MGLFGRSNKPKKIQGNIGYYNLSEWWLSTFTEEEQEYIAFKLGSRWIEDEFAGNSKLTVATVLITAAQYFSNATDRRLARPMLAEAERQAEISGDVLGLHFTYSEKIKTYYKDRDNDPEAFDVAISTCEKQIKLGPQAALAWRKDDPGEDLPAHTGFNQLLIIRDKQKDYDEAIRVCKEAIAQGWSGGWETAILKLETKRSKALKP